MRQGKNNMPLIRIYLSFNTLFSFKNQETVGMFMCMTLKAPISCSCTYNLQDCILYGILKQMYHEPYCFIWTPNKLVQKYHFTSSLLKKKIICVLVLIIPMVALSSFVK